MDLAGEDFLGARIWRAEGAVHIDVADLPPPDPFVATMRLLSWSGVGDEVVFYNDRKPVHLLPELADLGWDYRVEVDQPDQFRMRIIREDVV